MTRLAIIVLVALLTMGLAKAFGDWRTKQKGGRSLTAPIKTEIEGLGEEVLGKIVDVLPGAPNLEEVAPKGELSQEGEVKGEENQAASETEPFEEPVQNVQKQTEVLIETIKELPQDQIEAIKKQIYKEFCEGLLKEE